MSNKPDKYGLMIEDLKQKTGMTKLLQQNYLPKVFVLPSLVPGAAPGAPVHPLVTGYTGSMAPLATLAPCPLVVVYG